MIVEAKVRPLDVEQIHVRQETRLVLSAFNRREKPFLDQMNRAMRED